MPARQTVLRHAGLTLAGGLAGMAITLMTPAFSVMALGRVASLQVAMALGPWWGLAATIITLAPYGYDPTILFFVAEVLVVGIAVRHMPVVLAMGGLTTALVATLIVAGRDGFTHLSPLLLVTIASWHLAIVSFAELIFMVAAPRLEPLLAWQAPRRPMRAYLLQIFIVVATVPPLMLNLIGGSLYGDRQEAEAAARLEEAAVAMSQDVETHVDWHLKVVQTLAAELQQRSPLTYEQTQALLREYGQRYDGFRTLIVADRIGTIVNDWTVAVLRQGRPGEYAGRQHLETVMATKQPLVSGVVVGRRSGVPGTTVAVP